jgi:ParB/Sulfiredoxin domain
MRTKEFIQDVNQIPTSEIRPSAHNPRGEVEKDESFERLVSSIERVGILVPLVVSALPKSQGGIKYELVDGERRFRAAMELGRKTVPAHVLRGHAVPRDLRMLMFHLHMTREQWGPMAQCRSLVDAFPELRDGLTFEEKPAWVRKLSEDAGVPPVTARDRIHVLSWPRELKERFFQFDEEQPDRKIYTYVLALEASIIEPSRVSFPDFYNGKRTADEAANSVRDSLLTKTIEGIETGALGSREQIRSVSPLFSPRLRPDQKKTAIGLFRDFVNQRSAQFEDIRAAITTQLPELLEEKPAKPQRVIAAIAALTRTLTNYEVKFIDASTKTETKRRKLKKELADALDDLVETAENLRAKI